MSRLAEIWKPSYAISFLLIVVGSFLAGTWYSKRGTNPGSAPGGRRILYYIDPMHPAYKSDKPGIAPDCGMQLEPVYADSVTSSAGGADPASLPAGTVHLGPEKQQIIGVQLGQVEKSPGARMVRLLGRVAADETRIFRLNAAIDGWIRETFDNSTGSLVKKDEVLASFYSPEFIPAEQSYLYALVSLNTSQEIGKEAFDKIARTRPTAQLHLANLRNLGMSELQIQEITRTRQLAQNIWITSPTSGFVLVRNVSVGQRFEKGSEIYRIADLSHVWILADIFENEAHYFRPGARARVILPSLGKVFQAKVSSVLPQFDPNSRTLKMRLEMDNPDFTLRPDMLVDVELPVRLPAAITVPADAVLDSGLKKTVFVERGNGYFEPRRVETGSRYGDRVEILRGLEPGERIVVSGNFLIDSESRMKLAAAGLYGDLNKDPVCGMDVAEGKAKAAGRTSEYRGKTYYFCSDHCREQFRNDPERYVKPQAGTYSPSSAAGNKKEQPKQEAVALHDPVCGMDVDESEAKAGGLKSEYRGRTYYFCSEHCKQDFDKDPARYQSQGSAERAHD